MKLKRVFVLLVHAFVGWALCGAVIAVGQRFTSMENTLIIHAVGVPFIFLAISYVYFKKFHYTSPFWTALFFLVFAAGMDFFVVSLLINKNFDMFQNVLGTWIPFALIFCATYLTGRKVCQNRS